MRIKTGIMFLIISFLFTAGCDDIFDSWFNTPAHEREVEWKLVDGPMESISDPYSNANSPWLGVRDGSLFAAWVAYGTINFYRYNGDDKNPAWTFESDFTPGTPDSLSFCTYNNSLLYAYYDSGTLFVRDTFGTYYGTSVATPGFIGPLQLTVYSGQLCLLWHDGNYIQISMYNSATDTWNNSMGDIYGINDVDTIVNRFRTAVIDDFLYVAFISDVNPPLIPNEPLKVRRYDGTGWITVFEELNYYSGVGYANFPAITGYKGEAAVSWTETDIDNRLSVRIANSGEWLDGGYENYTGISWTGDPAAYKQMTEMTKVNGNLCLMWVEDINDPIWGFFQSLRVSVYKRDSDDFIPWSDITGSGSTGLNTQTGYSAMAPYGIEYDDKLYVAFLEMNINGWNALHVKVAH